MIEQGRAGQKNRARTRRDGRIKQKDRAGQKDRTEEQGSLLQLEYSPSSSSNSSPRSSGSGSGLGYSLRSVSCFDLQRKVITFMSNIQVGYFVIRNAT